MNVSLYALSPGLGLDLLSKASLRTLLEDKRFVGRG